VAFAQWAKMASVTAVRASIAPSGALSKFMFGVAASWAIARLRARVFPFLAFHPTAATTAKWAVFISGVFRIW